MKKEIMAVNPLKTLFFFHATTAILTQASSCQMSVICVNASKQKVAITYHVLSEQCSGPLFSDPDKPPTTTSQLAFQSSPHLDPAIRASVTVRMIHQVPSSSNHDSKCQCCAGLTLALATYRGIPS